MINDKWMKNRGLSEAPFDKQELERCIQKGRCTLKQQGNSYHV